MYCIDCATYVLCLVRHIRIVSMTVNDKDYLVGQNEILVILVPKNKGYLVGRNENLQNEILVTLVPQGKDPSSVDVVIQFSDIDASQSVLVRSRSRTSTVLN